jgi:hypothetical protein
MKVPQLCGTFHLTTFCTFLGVLVSKQTCQHNFSWRFFNRASVADTLFASAHFVFLVTFPFKIFSMKTPTPFSFKIFITNTCLTLIVVLSATFLSGNPAYRKYAVLMALPIILIFTMSAIGIYSAATKKQEEARAKTQNRIGLFGNLALCLFFLSVIIGGMVMAMR